MFLKGLQSSSICYTVTLRGTKNPAGTGTRRWFSGFTFWWDMLVRCQEAVPRYIYFNYFINHITICFSNKTTRYHPKFVPSKGDTRKTRTWFFVVTSCASNRWWVLHPKRPWSTRKSSSENDLRNLHRTLGGDKFHGEFFVSEVFFFFFGGGGGVSFPFRLVGSMVVSGSPKRV